ncbi:MAG TPA: ABC-2 family transporter protein [Fimbriimonadaceae bacterium]|nr:ABC-2 family transporter protein [Fimbriimonadaceae bacterium]
MARYWKIYRTFFTSSFARELEFRANFVAKIIQNAVWIFFFLMVLLVIYRNTDTVAGWNRGDAFILFATVSLMNSIFTGFFFSLNEIPQHVRLGTLDFIITKPVDTQFWISIRKFEFGQIGTFLAGLAMVAIGVVSAHVHPSLVQWAGYLILIFSALLIFYSFNLILMTTGIWLVRVDNLWVLGETLTQIARFPIDIYGMALRRAFIFFVPLAFIATIPSSQLKDGFDARMVGLGLVWAAVFLVAARWFWRFALTRYTSASS